MSYMHNRDIHFFSVTKGQRKWHSLVPEHRAEEHIEALRASAWKAYREGRSKRLPDFEARTVWGEVVEL